MRSQRQDRIWRGMLRTAAATAAFALLHSALASRPAKLAAERALGERRRNALYRPMFNAVAVVTSGLLVREMARQPSRVLYHIRGSAAVLMRLGQAASLLFMARAARRVGVPRLSGWTALARWWRGSRVVPREPEAQNPPAGELGYRPGPFAVSRNPLNFGPIPLVWLNPRMTTTWAAFSAVATAYFAIGSAHSDRRMRQAYGQAYEDYHRRVPLLVPGTRGRRMRTSFPIRAQVSEGRRAVGDLPDRELVGRRAQPRVGP